MRRIAARRFRSGTLEQSWRGDSRYLVLALSAGRAVAVGAAGELSLSVAALWQRYDLTLPPPCRLSDSFCLSIPVDDRYDIPAGAAMVGARRPLGPRLEAAADATLAFGRADTSSFWVDFIPELDHLESPRTQTVRTLRTGVGLVYRFWRPDACRLPRPQERIGAPLTPGRASVARLISRRRAAREHSSRCRVLQRGKRTTPVH